MSNSITAVNKNATPPSTFVQCFQNRRYRKTLNGRETNWVEGNGKKTKKKTLKNEQTYTRRI